MLSLSSLKINLYNALMSGASNAAMSLDFLSGTLDPRITFSRGSNATLVDATGKIVYAPANLVLQSQSFSTAPWESSIGGTGVANTVTADAGDAPDGTTTADRVQFNLGGGTTAADITRRRQQPTVPSANTIFSVWIKSFDGTSTYNMHLQDAAGATRNIVVTGTWTQFTASAAYAATAYVGLGLRGGQAPANSNTADVLVWGAQLEPVTYQTTPSPYVATTASAYYGPRFDYDPVTLAPKGLLIEEARTNLLTYSEQFDNASWTKVSATVTANATVSPDGTTNADSLLETATTAEHQVNSTSPTFAASTAYTFSAYVKSIGGRNCSLFWYTNSINTVLTATFDLTAGTIVTPATGSGSAPPTSVSASITPAANGYYRVTITGTTTATAGAGAARIHAASGTSNNYLGDIAKGISAYGAQLEVGSFATSYIPTVASTVTRSADVATMTGTNFSSWYNQSEGTFVWAGSPFNVTTPITGLFSANDGTTNNRVDFRNNTDALVTTGGVGQALLSTPLLTINLINKVAMAVKLNDFAAVSNGGTVATDAAGTMPTVTRLLIGALDAGANYFNGHIRQIAYYNTRLPNAQLQVLST